MSLRSGAIARRIENFDVAVAAHATALDGLLVTENTAQMAGSGASASRIGEKLEVGSPAHAATGSISACLPAELVGKVHSVTYRASKPEAASCCGPTCCG
jgi:hypothetical protein